MYHVFCSSLCLVRVNSFPVFNPFSIAVCSTLCYLPYKKNKLPILILNVPKQPPIILQPKDLMIPLLQWIGVYFETGTDRGIFVIGLKCGVYRTWYYFCIAMNLIGFSLYSVLSLHIIKRPRRRRQCVH